ncbi:sigma-54-dependent Fis family transcriptional regulator [Tabrizicola sp.]|uniref:sigma-54-dependent Fis family transcriptional regulator n=1 Tax=Tabrizicola sp. TaxID=2005166 RepID=UPI0027364397|nr:sigma 54-interacting transcriptional regulator [Tabrizicola sp.]MDP3195541.1 sigma 54-interacting transcriptional regulator [Tabrizicola sp.]
MSSNEHSRNSGSDLGFDFATFDPQETTKAWNRFLANRNAPSLPLKGVRSVIYQSWQRSNTVGVKPEQFAAPVVEGRLPVDKSAHDNAELRRATLASLNHIGTLLSGAEAMLILTDRKGVILDTVGDTSTLNKARKINLTVGGVWSEDAAGTNGIGTALFMGAPVYVHGDEHFCEGMKAWSCAAAPIRDPVDQSIIGVINLSGLTTIFQKHNAAFAATAARDIEVAIAQEQSLLNMRLMEETIGHFPKSFGPNDGLAIIDRFGRLIFNSNCNETVPKLGQGLGLGARFLDLPDGLSEEMILRALPEGLRCQDIRLLKIDGNMKGAALVFNQPAAFPSARPAALSRAVAPDLPGVAIPNTNLKIVGQSSAILETLDTARRIDLTDAAILIEGQTGVGKQLFARLIHARVDQPGKTGFTTINCGAITEGVFRDRLLGSDEADAGPLLCLDEIGELHPENQTLLLRYLEERLIRLTGPETPNTPLVLISLTNRNLQAEVEAGRFRRDLFYRLGSTVLTIPPLKDRGDDVLLIAEHYNRKLARETGRDLLIFDEEVQSALLAHSWPGNVRELRNAIINLHALAKSRHVTVADLPRAVTTPTPGPVDPTLMATHDRLQAGSVSLRMAEVLLIETALAQHRGNLSSTARALGISRPTLYRKLNDYGIGARPDETKP